MSDEIVTRLNTVFEGRYRIERELGAGGMATVYLADDLKHGRKVAVKVLRPELAAVIGGERFTAEIRTTAQLQHPHILPLFDSGEADGFLYYVMPYVEGESLRDRLDRERQLDVEDAVHIASAVASALQYAHDRSVIHRDIKPANILLHAGEPLVADFGIALAVSAAGGGRLTETGLSLGTPHYMSPEQAAADRDISPRSDVYSLACVLYEMLTGQPPHTGPTAQSILVRILTEEPRPVTDVRQSVPNHVAASVSKGLHKLPADRFRSAEAFKKALEDPSFTHLQGDARATADRGRAERPGSRARRSWRLVHLAVTGLLALAAGWLAIGGRDEDPPLYGQPIAFTVEDGLPVGTYLQIEVGADGTIAYAPGGAILVRRPGALEPTPLVDADWAEFSFSPDGDEIVFTPNFPGTTLRKVRLDGRPLPWRHVTERDSIIGEPLWGEDGWIYFNAGPEVSLRPRLLRVPEAGGEAEELLDVPGHSLAPSSLLPGGRALLYTQMDIATNEPRVMLLDLDRRDTTVLLGAGNHARWSPTGHLVYGHPTGALWAVPFDPVRRRVTGDPVPVQDGVLLGRWWTHYGLNKAGTLAYMVGFGPLQQAFLLFDEAGSRERLPIDPTDDYHISISPNGGLAAYTREGDIRIIDLDRGSEVALIEGEASLHDPIWSPDGRRVAYYEDGVGPLVRPVDLSTEASPLAGSSTALRPSQWLDDGTIMLSGNDIAAAQIDGNDPPRMLLNAAWIETAPSVSPDGRWLAYRSDRDGPAHLYVRSWPDLEGETRVSDEPLARDVQAPQWAPDSGTLYYLAGGEIIAADLTTGTELAVERRRTLGPAPGLLVGSHPDGRLLFSEQEGSTGEPSRSTQLIGVANWFTTLRERADGN